MRTWAETFGGCVLEELLYAHVLLFIPEAEDPIMDDRRLAYIVHAICHMLDAQRKFGSSIERTSSPTHTSCPHFRTLPLFS